MNLESNKIFAAILVAGITASFSGFLASNFVKPDVVKAHGSEEVVEQSVAPQLPEPVLALVAAAETERGQKLFRACAACHTVGQGGPDGVGPNLWNAMARGKAAKDGYAYSAVLSEKAGEKWAYLDLNKFLWKPKKYLPGTKMNFIGIKKPEDRAAMIAYLRSLSDSAPALPSAGEISAEEAELMPAVEEDSEDAEEASSEEASGSEESSAH